MELRKCHLFFSCGTMKFFLFLLFLLPLSDSLQGSTISHKRSIRALNTTLETNFNGTYERRNPCTNAEIETTSYVASHEFRHHTAENNWNDYTHKCSSIISSFLQALGNLVRFNNEQNGVFSFHINTFISQKQDSLCEADKRASCDTWPTITIEATDCELYPKSSCGNLSGEQICQDQKEKESLKGEICRTNQALSEKAPRTPNFNQNSVISKPQSGTEYEITPTPPLDASAAEDGRKVSEVENVWNVDDIFLPVTEFDTSVEPEFQTTGFLTGNKNYFQNIKDASESAPTDYQTKESFNVPSSSHSDYLPQMSHFGPETTPEPTADEEPLYPNQFSDLPLRKQQPTAHSKLLFDDNFDSQVTESEILPNPQPDNSFIFPNQISKAPFIAQESSPIKIHQPKSIAFEEHPLSLQQQFPFQQSLQNGKQFDNLEKIQTGPNTDISSETEKVSYSSQKYLTKSEDVPFNQITNAEPPQIPDSALNEKQFMNCEGQTSALGFSTSYPTSPAQMLPIERTAGKTIADEDNHQLQKTTKQKAQAVDYPDEFFKAQPNLEDNLGSFTLNNASPNNNEGVSSSDDLSTFSISKPLIDLTTSTSNERSWTEKSFYDVNDNQFLPIPTPERPSFYFSNESPLLTSESQKLMLYDSEESPDESNTDKVTDAEFPLSSNQYQSIARPKSQSLPNYPDQYDNVEKATYTPEANSFNPHVQFGSEVTTSKPYFQSFSATPKYQSSSFTSFDETASPSQYPADITSDQKFSSSDYSTSDYESSSSSQSETFSDEYLITLPPKQNSFENSGIYTSSSPVPTSFYDYQDPLYSKPDLESSFTTPMQYFSEDIYEFANESRLTDNQDSDESQPTTLTISGFEQLKQKTSSYPDLTSEQPLNYASNSLIPTQNHNVPKVQRHQVFEKSQDSLPDIKPPLSTPQYNDFSTESFKTKSSMNYDTEVPPENSIGPLMEKHSNDSVLISNHSEQNLDESPNFTEKFSEENQTIFSPQSFMPNNNEELFPDRSSFGNKETTPYPVFSPADDYLEPIVANNYQKIDFPAKFPKDSDARSEKFFSKLFTTPLPSVSFPPENFLSSSNYKTISGNSLTHSQIEKSLPPLDQSVNKNFPPEFEEFSRVSFRNVKKFDSDFSAEENLKQYFEPSETTSLDISSKTIPLTLTKNQELQSNVFQIPDSLVLAPYNQLQKTTSYTSYPTEDFSKDSQSSSVKDFDVVVSSESHFTKPEIYRNRALYRQSADKINAFQPLQRGSESYNQLPSAAPLQSTVFDDKVIKPSKDNSSAVKFASQMEPSVHDPKKQIFKPYSEPYFAPTPQPYQYQSESSSQTLLEEYSAITPIAKIPFNIDETTASSIPEASSLRADEQSKPQYTQEKLSDYPSSFAPEQQLKPQPSNDYILEIPGKNVPEKSILSLQNSNSENIPFFEVKPDKSVPRSSYSVYIEANKQDAAVDYQSKYKELDYLDESPNINSDLPVPDFSNPTQSLIASPPLNSIPHAQFRPNNFTPFPQSPAPISHQLNNNLNDSPQKSSDISLLYPQSKKEISFVTDNISPQPRLTTAVYNDEEKTEMLSTSKPQPQTPLTHSDDNIPKQLSNLPNQQYQITPDAAFSSELKPVPSMSFPPTQRITVDFETSNNDANNQTSFLFPSQGKQLDIIIGSPDQTQNNFYPKLSSRISNASPLYTATTIQNQREPSRINSAHLYNSREQFSPYNLAGFQPDFNGRPISLEYPQNHPAQSVVYNRFSSNNSPREPNETFQYPEVRRVTASRYGPERALNPKEEFQTQLEVPPVNNDRNRFPSVASKHLAIQTFDERVHPKNIPTQNSDYSEREPVNVVVSNSYNNEPVRQTNRVSPQHLTIDAVPTQNSFEIPFPFNSDQYSERSGTERSPYQTIKNADSPSYDDYDQILSSQLPNEKLLEYDEDVAPKPYVENTQMVQTYRQQGQDMVEGKPRQISDDFLREADPPLGFNRKADTYDFQDRSPPNDQPSSFPSPPIEKEQHSNPLLHTLESHLTFPFEDHLRPSAPFASFTDVEKESIGHSFSFDPQNRNEFQDASAVPSYFEGRDSKLNFDNDQRSHVQNEVDAAQDVTNTRQPDSQVLVSDPNIPSNKPGENFVSCSGQNPTPLLCPLNSILKGNMTAPSYYILVSKQPVDDDKEEQFKVEKVYLGDGMPLNCTLSTGKTFPTSLHAPLLFSAPGLVKLRTKSDLA